jgi:very-short-patch-repair endonuclease
LQRAQIFYISSDGFHVQFRLEEMKHSQPITYARAKGMRNEQTEAERKLWGALRNRRLCDLKFYRQVPIGPYIVDFICHEHGVVVELDGATHSKDSEIVHDEKRARFLQTFGLVVHRVWNSEIHGHFEDAVNGIYAVVTEQPKKDRRDMKWLPQAK